MTEIGSGLLGWLATAWLHALAMLCTVWLIERTGVLRSLALREVMWRAALILPLLTALIAVSTDRADWRWVAASVPLDHAAEPVAQNQTNSVIALTVDNANANRTATSSAPLSRHDSPDTAPGNAARQILPAIHLPALAGWSWLLFAAAALTLAGLRLRRLRRRVQTLPAVGDNDLHRVARSLAQQAGIPSLKLIRDDSLSTPVAIAPDTIGVPGWSLSHFDQRQRAAMLAHEVAHLARRDPQWRMLARAAVACLPTPLSSLAVRRLDDLAELQCDAWSVATTGDGRALAECLAACLEPGRQAARPEFALPMAAADSPLVERVRRLITEQTMHEQKPGAMRQLLIVTALTAVTAMIPHLVFSQAHAQSAASPGAAPTATIESQSIARDTRKLTSSSSQYDTLLFGRHTKVTVSGAGYELTAMAKGNFTFNDAEDDLVSLSDRLEIEERDGDVSRWLRFEKKDGQILRSYKLDGRETAFDAQTRNWLARAIPTLMRATGIEAQARVERIHGRGGASAVLDEIEMISSDYVRSKYLRLLYAQGELHADAALRSIALGAEIDSDYDQRVAMVAAVKSQSLDAAAQRALYALAGRIGSDYERRLLLVAAVPLVKRNPALVDGWLGALDRNQSSYEHRLALQALAAADVAHGAALIATLNSVAQIESSYERRLILADLAAAVGSDERAASTYAGTASKIGSDYEKRLALVALIKAMTPTASNCAAALGATASIGSDYEARLALTALAARMPREPSLIEAYRAAARKLGDYERGRAEKALDRFYEA